MNRAEIERFGRRAHILRYILMMIVWVITLFVFDLKVAVYTILACIICYNIPTGYLGWVINKSQKEHRKNE